MDGRPLNDFAEKKTTSVYRSRLGTAIPGIPQFYEDPRATCRPPVCWSSTPSAGDALPTTKSTPIEVVEKGITHDEAHQRARGCSAAPQ
jgi:hypothetical protein